MMGLIDQVMNNGAMIEKHFPSEIDEDFFASLKRDSTPYHYDYLIGYNKRRTKDMERYMRFHMGRATAMDLFIINYDRAKRKRI